MSQMVIAATAWGTDTIMPNYENEAGTITPDNVMSALVQTGWAGHVGWSMQGWLPNAPNYAPMTIRKQPVLLQIFPSDMKANFPGDTRHDPAHVAKIAGDCVWHARVDKGFTYVGVTYQSYADMTSADFDCGSFMHSTFPGNTITRDKWDGWYQ